MNHEEKKYSVSIVWKIVLGIIATLSGLGLCLVFKTVYENITRV